MFRGLRLQLTLLYLLAALGLLLLLGGGTYGLLHSYFQASTDLALRFRMAQEFQARGLGLPPELADAVAAWSGRSAPVSLLPLPTATARLTQGEDGEESEDGAGETGPASEVEVGEPQHYDAELTAIFALPLTAQAQLVSNPNPFAPPVAPNGAALAAALIEGSDLRTVHDQDGPEVRLLTYRLSEPEGMEALQLGRTTSDQERALDQLLMILVGLGALGAAGLAVSSWWLAGRSLLPAQRAWERQQTFVANASHELRAPLTLIRASAEVARRGVTGNDAQNELLGDVLQETDHMSKLVEDLLLLSRLDAGRVTLAREPVDLAGLLDDLVRQVRRIAEIHGITLRLEQASGTVEADPTRLRQVLLIVLDNALQATPAGGQVVLAASPRGRRVIVTVTDTGRGLTAEERSHIFERFFKAADSKGSGLGLAIARNLVLAHGGEISAESAPAGGTTFRISFPASMTV